jgi:hypothetical protein
MLSSPSTESGSKSCRKLVMISLNFHCHFRGPRNKESCTMSLHSFHKIRLSKLAIEDVVSHFICSFQLNQGCLIQKKVDKLDAWTIYNSKRKLRNCYCKKFLLRKSKHKAFSYTKVSPSTEINHKDKGPRITWKRQKALQACAE